MFPSIANTRSFRYVLMLARNIASDIVVVR